MATATKKKPRPPRAKKLKQQFLPTMEPPSNPAVDAAAEIYVDARDERQKLSKEEKQAKVNLIEKMKEAGLDIYETPDGQVVALLNDTDVKVKAKKQVKSEDSDTEE